MGRFELKVGDVFSVPIDDSRVGVGQVVAACGEGVHYLAIFDVVAVCPSEIDIELAVRARVIFLALSNDAKLYAGHWAVVGNAPVADGMPFPAWRMVYSMPDRVDVVDYTGTRRRPASEAEAELLPDETLVAPVRLEKALRAKHGIGLWKEAYSELAPDETMTTERLFSGG